MHGLVIGAAHAVGGVGRGVQLALQAFADHTGAGIGEQQHGLLMVDHAAVELLLAQGHAVAEQVVGVAVVLKGVADTETLIKPQGFARAAMTHSDQLAVSVVAIAAEHLGVAGILDVHQATELVVFQALTLLVIAHIAVVVIRESLQGRVAACGIGMGDTGQLAGAVLCVGERGDIVLAVGELGLAAFHIAQTVELEGLSGIRIVELILGQGRAHALVIDQSILLVIEEGFAQLTLATHLVLAGVQLVIGVPGLADGAHGLSGQAQGAQHFAAEGIERALGHQHRKTVPVGGDRAVLLAEGVVGKFRPQVALADGVGAAERIVIIKGVGTDGLAA
ncbi:hypothetical protein D3C73_802920 [compost metagenome]